MNTSTLIIGSLRSTTRQLHDAVSICRDAGTGGAGGAAAPLAFCWEGQGGQKCPLSIKNII